MGEVLKRHWFKIALAALVVIAGCVYLFNKVNEGSDLPVKGKAANFKMEDISGKQVTLKTTDDKVRLVYFFFSTCPDVCTPTTHLLYQVQEKLKKAGVYGDKTSIISISFDPTNDTVEQLKAFAKQNGADLKGWYFLRGGEQYAIDLAKKYKVDVFKSEGTFTHANLITLVDGEGNIRNQYIGNSLNLTPQQIADDMVKLTKDL